MRRATAGQGGRIPVTLAEREYRHMDPGLAFGDHEGRGRGIREADRLSESRRHVVAREDALAREIGLTIESG